MACTVAPRTPVMVSAAVIELRIASSVACTVAASSGSSESLATKVARASPVFVSAASALAVDSAMKMSPDALWASPPTRPIPSDTRRASRLS